MTDAVLEDLLHLFIEPVDAGHDHPLDRIGDGDGFDGGGSLPVAVFGADRPSVDEGPHDLFEKERIASAFWRMSCLVRGGRFSMLRRLFMRSVHSVGERGLRRISV